MRRGALAPLLGLLGLPLAAAAADAAPRWEVEAGAGRETLSTGAPSWRQLDAALRRRAADGSVAEGGLRRATRYGGSDVEASAALLQPFGDWSLGLRVTGADAPRFLPRLGVEAEASRRIGGGWVLGAGLARRLYADADQPGTGTSLLRAGAEWYGGPWRLAAAASRVRLDGGPAGNGWRVQADRFFGDVARLGLIVAGGDEVETAPGGALFSRSDAVVLVAQWPLAPGWTLLADFGRTRVRDLERRSDAGRTPAGPGYDRRGGRLGVRVEF